MLLISLIPEWKSEDVMVACLKRAIAELKPDNLLMVADGYEASIVAGRLAEATGFVTNSVVIARVEDLPDNRHHSRRVAQLREVARAEALKREATSVFWLDCDVLLPKGTGKALSKARGAGAVCVVTAYPDRLAGYMLPPRPEPGTAGLVPAGNVTGMGACWMDATLLAARDFEGYLASEGWFPSYGEDDWFIRPLQEQGLVMATGLVGAHHEQRSQTWRVYGGGGIHSAQGRNWREGAPVKLKEEAGALAVPGKGKWKPGDERRVDASLAAALLGNPDFELGADPSEYPKLILPEV